jgi:hypothetical protein
MNNFLNTVHFTKAHKHLSQILTFFCCSFCVLLGSVNNFRTYSASWETNSLSVTQQISCVVFDTKVPYRVHKSPACGLKRGIENCDIRACIKASQSKSTYRYPSDRVLLVLPDEALLSIHEFFFRTVTPPVVYLPVLIVQPSWNCIVCPLVYIRKTHKNILWEVAAVVEATSNQFWRSWNRASWYISIVKTNQMQNFRIY